MDQQVLFNFKTAIARIKIPTKLNNPFGLDVPEIASIAAKEFQAFIASESQGWKHDFHAEKGKMFGILVVQKADNSYGYLGTISGKIPGDEVCKQFVPSVFDVSTGDYFINKGMRALTEIGKRIKKSNHQAEINLLTEDRRQKSFALQQRLFENYRFLNILGVEKNVLQIFEDSSHGNPPAAAGECAAPKLLQYALKHELKPIALAEFWWGKPSNNLERAPHYISKQIQLIKKK
jgi:tRNA pseudouridine32 synthase/23S rRNA pseudouridine746 synthase